MYRQNDLWLLIARMIGGVLFLGHPGMGPGCELTKACKSWTEMILTEYVKVLPCRKLTYPTLGSLENHRLKHTLSLDMLVRRVFPGSVDLSLMSREQHWGCQKMTTWHGKHSDLPSLNQTIQRWNRDVVGLAETHSIGFCKWLFGLLLG